MTHHSEQWTSGGQASMDHMAISKPLRVLFATQLCLPATGGIELLTVREARALRAEGHSVRIVTLRVKREWAREEQLEGVPCRRTGGLFVGGRLRLKLGAQWLAEAALWYELIRTRTSYDIIHLRHVGFIARPVALASMFLRKPLVVQLGSAGPGKRAQAPSGGATTLYVGTLDPAASYLRIAAGSWDGSDLDRLRHSQWLAALTLRLLRRRGVTFLAVSERMRANLIADGVRTNQIVLLPTGIEPESYEEAFRHIEVRTQMGATGPQLVLCVAGYRYPKGLDILLHAWKRVREQGFQARLMLAGGGQLHAQLAAMVAALGLDDSVELTGVRHDVPSLLGEADVFVLPSRHEGLPNALLEAMAAGLPCVATRVSGSEDVIVDEECGLLVPPDDPEALAAALVRMLTRPAEARVLGRAARDRIVRSYDRRDLMRQLEALYTRLARVPLRQQIADEHYTSSELAVAARPHGDEHAR